METMEEGLPLCGCPVLYYGCRTAQGGRSSRRRVRDKPRYCVDFTRARGSVA